MDHWSEKALKMMTLGGNKNLYEFFRGFDLNDESVETRYKTKAADFYRQKVSETSQFSIKNIHQALTIMFQPNPSHIQSWF